MIGLFITDERRSAVQVLALPTLTPTAAPAACVAALGFFDGMHRAHTAVLRTAAHEARRRSLPLLVFTFASCGAPKGDAPRLSTDEERAALFYEAGASLAVFADFPTLAALSPEEFVSSVLAFRLGVSLAVVGEDFRFGYRAAGEALSLRRLMEAEGGGAYIVPSILEGGEPISSTRIRSCLTTGDCEGAARLLGRLYTLALPVLHGASLGASLGFPTANQRPEKGRMLPQNGVYRTAVTLPDGRCFDGVTDVGTRPTVEGSEVRMETHILDFSGDLYGNTLRVAFASRLRGEIAFPTLDALKEQIKNDCKEVRAWRLQSGYS